MDEIRKRQIEKKTNMYLFVIFLYLIGPTTFRIANAYLSDMFFALFFVYALFTGTKLSWKNRTALVFLIPFVIVLTSNIGKYISGFPLGVDEFANTIKTLQLYVMIAFSIGIFHTSCDFNYFNKTFKKFIRIISLAVIYNSFIGILQYFDFEFIKLYLEQFYYFVSNYDISNVEIIVLENRITGIFESWNGVGFFLTQTLFLLIIFQREKKSLIGVIAIIFGFIALILAGSRAATIGMIFSLFLYSTLVIKSKKTLIGFVITILILPPLVILFSYLDILPEENIKRFTEISDFFIYGTIPGNWEFRLDSWSWMPGYILSSPYFLFGFPNFVWKSSLYYWGADSQYVSWLLYYGAIGLILYVIWSFMIILSFKKMYKRMMQIDKNAMVTRFFGAFAIIFFSYIIIGLSQDSLLANRWRELFLSFVGFTVSWGQKIKNEQRLSGSLK